MPRSYADLVPDVVGRFRQGYARQRASVGDYDGAMRAAPDAEMQESYARMADRQRRRDREEEALGAQRSYASSLASGDYAGAATVAGKVGDAEGVTSATEQQRLELWRGASLGASEAEAIDSMQPAEREGAYRAFIQRGREALQRNPRMDPELARIIQGAPDTYTPSVTGGIRTYAQRLQASFMTPELRIRMEEEQRERERRRERPMTPEAMARYNLRPGTSAVMDGENNVRVLSQPPIAAGYEFNLDGTQRMVEGGPAALRSGSYLNRAQASSDVGRRDQFNEEAEAAAATVIQLERFAALNREQPTGRTNLEAFEIGGFRPFAGAETQEMEQIIAALTPSQRVPGSGATSDFDARMFMAALPSLTRDPPVNANIIEAYRRRAQLLRERAQASADWLDEYGNLRQFDGLWLEYANANPIFAPNATTDDFRINQQRVGFAEWYASGGGGGDEAAGSSPAGEGGDAPPMPPRNQRVVGQRYTMPDGGIAVWNGHDFD